jgi:hypothetical protein
VATAIATALLAALLAVAGGSMLVAATRAPSPPPSPPSSAAGAAAATSVVGPATADDALRAGARRPAASDVGVAGLGRSRPVALAIPRIGVRTALMDLGLNPDGTVAVPPLGRDAPAGWYRYLASPGEPGPAVILGHVDSARDGPAVFYRLGELRPGDLVAVTRADGGTVRFVVTSVVRVPKQAFPTEAVYGATADPQLRLITCGGAFDPGRHSYRDNVIAFARMLPP